MYINYRQIGLLLALPLAMASQVRGETAEDRFATAARHYEMARQTNERSHWQRAVVELRSFLDDYAQHPQSAEAVIFLAEAFMNLREFEQALRQYEVFLTDHVRGMPVYESRARFRVGEIAFLTGQYDHARPALGAFRKRFPQDPLLAHALAYLGNMALQQPDAQAAVDFYGQALQRIDARTRQGDAAIRLRHECLFGMAQAREQQGQQTVAQEIYAQVYADRAGHYADRALYNAALVAYKAEDLEVAGQLVASLEQDHPQSGLLTEARYVLGLVRFAQGQYVAAAAAFRRAEPSDSSHPLAPAISYRTGEALRHAGRLKEANRFFVQVKESWPDSELADDSVRGYMQSALDSGDHALVGELSDYFSNRFPDSPLVGEVNRIRARLLLSENKFVEAIELLDGSTGPHDPRTDEDASAIANSYLLGFALLGAKRYQDALQAFDRIKLDTQAPELIDSVQVARARALTALRRYADAIEPLRSYLRSQPDGPDATRCRADLITALASIGPPGQETKSLETFTRLFAEHPQDPEIATAALARAKMLEDAHHIDDALAMYHVVMNQCPHNSVRSRAVMDAARLYEAQGKHERAADVLAQYVAQHPDDDRLDAALYRWATLLQGMQRHADAEKQFTRLHDEMSGSPYWAPATLRLAEIAAAAAHNGHAMQLLDELSRARIDAKMTPRVLYWKGQLAAAADRWHEVIEPMQRLVSEFPADPLRDAAEYWIAEALYRNKHYDDAKKRLIALAKRTRGGQESWLAMIPLRQAQILVHEKQWHNAYTLASNIAKQSPNFQQQYEVDYVLGRCLSRMGRFREARTAYERVSASLAGHMSETAAMAQWMIGETYFQQKDYEQAIPAYLRIETLCEFPHWRAGGLLQAGKCFEIRYDYKAAIELYARLLKKYPDTPFREEASRRLRIARLRGRDASTL